MYSKKPDQSSLLLFQNCKVGCNMKDNNDAGYFLTQLHKAFTLGTRVQSYFGTFL